MSKTLKILYVDDGRDASSYQEALVAAGYRVDFVENFRDANMLVSESFSDRPYDVVIVETNMGFQYDGTDFVRRTVDFGMNTVVFTGDHASAFKLLFAVDCIVIKGKEEHVTLNTLLEVVRGLRKPRRINRNPKDVQACLWDATRYLSGINTLRLRTQEFPGGSRDNTVEKWTFEDAGKRLITCVVEPYRPRDRFVVCRVQATIGCDQMCPSCKCWRLQGKPGCVDKVLAAEEIDSQIYHMIMNSPRLKKAFRDDSTLGIRVQFTGGGDPGNNIVNCMASVYRMQEIERPEFSFLISSVGMPVSLDKCGDGCYAMKMKRLRLSWSFYSPDEDIRKKLVPGSRGCPTKDIADRFALISANASGQCGELYEILLVVTLFVGKNDRLSDAKNLVNFCKEYPFFRIVLLAGKSCDGGYSGYLRNVPDTNNSTVLRFKSWLTRCKIEGVEIWQSFGSEKGHNAGLGQTVPNF